MSSFCKKMRSKMYIRTRLSFWEIFFFYEKNVLLNIKYIFYEKYAFLWNRKTLKLKSLFCEPGQMWNPSAAKCAVEPWATHQKSECAHKSRGTVPLILYISHDYFLIGIPISNCVINLLTIFSACCTCGAIREQHMEDNRHIRHTVNLSLLKYPHCKP